MNRLNFCMLAGWALSSILAAAATAADIPVHCGDTLRLERYSHIRMTAKRDAVAGITLRQKGENSDGVPVKVPVVEQSARIQ